MRPGGLTALAIFNFVFGGLAALSDILGLATAELQLKNLEQSAKLLGQSPPTAGAFYAVLAIGLVKAGLLIMAGVGYLGLRRVSGRYAGNAYAILAFVVIVMEATLLPNLFTIFSLVEFVYPLITLFLLNFIFRKDFIR